jgi:hypothetical protein
MSLHRQIETTEPVSRKRISPTLQNHCSWLENLHHFGDEGLEERLVAFIINAVIQWHIESIIFAFPISNIPQIPCSWKVVPEFMKRNCHDPICGIESFFNTVTMVNIYIYVQYPLHTHTHTHTQSEKISTKIKCYVIDSMPGARILFECRIVIKTGFSEIHVPIQDLVPTMCMEKEVFRRCGHSRRRV